MNTLKLALDTKDDFGLSLLSLLILSFNSIMFLICLTLNKFLPQLLAPALASLLMLYLLPNILKLSCLKKFITCAALAAFTIILNYVFISHIDAAFGGLARLDTFIFSFESQLSNQPLALVIQNALEPFNNFAKLYYDSLILFYMMYFLIALVGAFIFYTKLRENKKFYIGKYILTITIFYILNAICYLLVPVTGPQYFLAESFTQAIPFSSFGLFLYNTVQAGHITLIDCFPSGHFGMCLLVTIILKRINYARWPIFAFISLGVALATISLRYHYVLDVLASFILIYASLKLSNKLWALRFRY